MAIADDAATLSALITDDPDASSTPRVVGLRAEQVPAGSVLGCARPRLSWVLEGGDPLVSQTRYEAEFTTDSGTEIATANRHDGVLVDWPFPALESRQVGRLRVRCETSDERWTDWSAPIDLVAGLLDAEDWIAQLVSPSTLGTLEDGAPFVFGSFDLPELPVAARLYASAQGVYEAQLNGARIGADVFAPGWTAYEKRLQYQSYDVSGLLVRGSNSLGAALGNGWYRGQLVYKGNRQSYGDRLAFLAQLELDFADGSRRIIGTDASWRACETGILFDDFYDGERRDLRLSVGPQPQGAEAVELLPLDAARLVARRGPAVRETGRIGAETTTVTESGRVLVDFGQNVVGWVEVTVRPQAPGTEVTIRHAEVLEGGELARRPLRTAQATCTYLLVGGQEEVLRPTFTCNGFRYVDISGVEADDLVSVTAVVLGTDLERIGWLETSDPLLNRLHANVVWSARGNFLDLPTDCPQRDERLGWTGDIQVFAPTANFLFDTSGFLAGWLEDLAAEQGPRGEVPYIVPDVLRSEYIDAPGWGDAAVVVPWELYRAFGDREVLRRQYPSMTAWVRRIADQADGDGVWNAQGPFGDWLDPTAPPDDPARAQADQAVVGTAYFARSARLMAQTARVLGEVADADEFDALAARVARGFERRFVSEDGRVRSDCQTVYALALVGELITDERVRAAAGRRLIDLVVEADYRVATGFLGTPVILDGIAKAGRPDVAYRMLTETGVPSWLYAVTMGATTTWERWDSMLPDGSVNPGTMTSFNHYAYGAVADWMHRTIGGITPLEAAYRRFEVRPLFVPDLEHASARHRCPFGDIRVGWRRESGAIHLAVRVPRGTEAVVHAPGASEAHRVGPGLHTWTGPVVEA